MAGSNGSPAQRGAYHPQQWPQESEEQVREREYERWLAMQRGQQVPPAHDPRQADPYRQQGQHHAEAAPPQGYGAHPGYPAEPDPGHGHAYPQHAGQREGYAPQFEPYLPGAAPHARPPEPESYDAGGHGHPGDFRPGVYPQEPVAQAGGHAGYEQPRGYEAGYADPRTGGHAPVGRGEPQLGDGRVDPRGYDLSHYAPGQMPPGYGSQPGYPAEQQPGWPHAAPQGHGHEPHWDPHEQPGHWQAQPAGAYPAHGQQLDGGHGGYGEAYRHQDQIDAHGGAPPHSYETEPLETGEERRGPGTLVIVGALVGAIFVGGGLAYGYKMLGGGTKTKPPVIKADGQPVRTRPAEPGGKSIEHTDKKVLDRLAGNEPPVPTSLKSTEADGPRKVSTTTIVVNRDGTVAPQVGQPAPPPIAASSGVPGLVIDGLGPPPGPPATAAPPRAQLPPPPAVRPALPPPPSAAPAVRNPPPKVADLPLPKVKPAEASERQPVPKRAPVRDDLIAQKSAVGAAPAVAAPVKKAAAAGGASGYVAVLASKRNRQEALNSFADLFQQYPGELAGRTPDVREVNLGAKGIWYRLIVGPPSSRQAANDLCLKLKERGYKDCWPVTY